jgi:acyl carrier protein
METDRLEERVKRLVADRMAVHAEQLTLAMRLQQDIGVDGADGWELMEAFGEQFSVDMRRFRPDLHFGSEGGCNPLAAVFLLVRRPRWARFVPITVGDLVVAARSRQWLTPDREPV